jgi:hypothetical protein
LPIKNRLRGSDLLTKRLHGFCAGGVSTIGGFGFGFAGGT